VFGAETEALNRVLSNSKCSSADMVAATLLTMKNCPLRTFESGTKKGLNVKTRIVAASQQERVQSFGQELKY
jgi:hypothetical protein